MKVKRIACGHVNCYLLSQNGRGVLVDAAGIGCADKISRICAGMGVKMELIFLTHGHIDHIGSAAALAAEWGVPIAMGGKDAGLVKDPLSQPMQTKGLVGKILGAGSGKMMRRTEIPAFTPEFLMGEGDSLREFGLDARVVDLPGHTAGSIGLDAAGKWLFVGDAMMNHFRPECPCLFADREEAERSVEKIRGLGQRTLFFGHGKPVEQ